VVHRAAPYAALSSRVYRCQHFLRVSGQFDLRPHSLDDSIGIHDMRRAAHPHVLFAIEALLSPHPTSIRYLMIAERCGKLLSLERRMRSFAFILAALLLGAAAGLPTPSSAQTGLLIIPAIPLMKQQHSLTCESSAVSMATRGQILESQLMSVMPRNANPNVGFRGSPDGQQGTKLVDYGVYAAPLQQALQRYGFASTVMSYGYDRDIKAFINRGWPVVAWVTYALQKATPRLAMHNGVQFVLVPHEHAITIVGYDNRTLIANDPWNRTQVRYFWSQFNQSWGYFGNMALAVEPCPTAMPVQQVNVSTLTSAALTWTWLKPIGAAHYAVTVLRFGAKSSTVYSGTQDTATYTVNNPRPGKTYEITVRSVSGCGDLTAPATGIVQIPLDFATPSPVPTEGVSASPTVTPTARITLTAASTFTATATPHP
jgi:uncharacterized protein YvpB